MDQRIINKNSFGRDNEQAAVFIEVASGYWLNSDSRAIQLNLDLTGPDKPHTIP